MTALKPIEIRRLEGGNTVSHRPLFEPILIKGRPSLSLRPPSNLNEGEISVWNEIVPDLHSAGILDGADSLMLQSLCSAVNRARQAAQLVDKEGIVIKNQYGNKLANPAIAIERDSWKQAIRIGEQFGLSPQARTRLGLMIQRGKTIQQELESLWKDDA